MKRVLARAVLAVGALALLVFVFTTRMHAENALIFNGHNPIIALFALEVVAILVAGLAGLGALWWLLVTAFEKEERDD